MGRDKGQGHGTGTSAQRRTQIIAATTRLIARDGVAALSTRTIAREANVNLGTLHHLFGAKDDLLLAVLDAATSALIAALILMDGHPGGGLRTALTESVATLYALLDREPSLPLVRCEVLLYARRRPLQAAATHQQQRYLDALAVCYRVAGESGELGLLSSEELAAVVSSSIDGLAVQDAMGVPLRERTAARAHMLRALLTLGPEPLVGRQGCADDDSPGYGITLRAEAR